MLASEVRERQQSGIDGAGALLALLVAMSMVIWALTLHGRARTVIAVISIVSFGLLAWAAGGNITKAQAQQQSARAEGGWQAWEPGRVDQILATAASVEE